MTTLIARRSRLRGQADIPGSKSHTIRACLLAALARGTSEITRPLMSNDTRAAVQVYTALGAGIDVGPERWRVQGTGGRVHAPARELDVGNSGTTLRLALGSLALMADGATVITGDHQIQTRPCAPLIQALNDLGAHVQSVNHNGCAPLRVQGSLKGGQTEIACASSQYLTALLLACPRAAGDSRIHVTQLQERGYVEITLDWLRRLGVAVEYDDDLSHIHIPGGQSWEGFERAIPADFSTATFFLAMGALGDNDIHCRGLDVDDVQPDRAVINHLERLGAAVDTAADAIRTTGSSLQGCALDLNTTPDALPMLAVTACCAHGETRLVNVPQARIKETDRIAVMCAELTKMGADIEELPDGLVVRQSTLHGADVHGHHDHRVVMALALAGTLADGTTRVDTAAAAAVTFPGFLEAVQNLGGSLELADD